MREMYPVMWISSSNYSIKGSKCRLVCGQCLKAGNLFAGDKSTAEFTTPELVLWMLNFSSKFACKISGLRGLWSTETIQFDAHVRLKPLITIRSVFQGEQVHIGNRNNG